MSYALLAVAPLCLGIGLFPSVRRWSRWKAALIQIVLVLVPAVIAVLLALRAFVAKNPSD